MNIFTQHRLSFRSIFLSVALLILQIPVSHRLFSSFLEDSSWHFHLVITFFAIALLLAYGYGLWGGLLSSVLSTVIVWVVETAKLGPDGEFDVSMTVTVAIATLATGVLASVAVGLLAHILQEQRKWLEALFASASDGFIVVSKTHEVLAMNAAAQQMTGWSVEGLRDAGGCATLFGCGRDPNKCPANHPVCPVSLSEGTLANAETEMVHRSGSLVPVSLSAFVVEVPFALRRRSRTRAVVLTMRDIATARRLQAELEGLAKVCTDISSLENVTEILEEIASRARTLFDADLITIALSAAGEGHLTVRHVAGEGAAKVVGSRFPSGEGALGRAYLIGSPVTVRHPADDPSNLADTDPLVKVAGIVSQIAVPFGGAAGASGVIAAGWRQQRVIAPNQVTVLRQLANLAGVAWENSHLLGQIQRRRQEAETLYHLGLEISSLSDFDRKLEHVLDATRTLVTADVTALWVVDERENQGTWKVVSACDPNGARAWLARSGQGLAAETVQAGRVLQVEHLYAPAGLRVPGDEPEGVDQFRAAVALPLRVRGKTIGALFAGYRLSPRVDEDSVLLLSGLSNQLSVALENARLYQRVQDLAVIEERHRLSREIHDGLAQIISVLNLRAGSLKKGLGRLGKDAGTGAVSEQVASLTREVDEFQAILDDAYGEIRHSIWTLREHQQSEHDLTTQLRDFVDQFRRYTGISVAFESQCPAELCLPLSTELHVTRIVQEALNNVRKHSGVKSAVLTVRLEGRTLALEVRDFGRGFAPELVNTPGRAGYGLSSMQERALAIGAELVVQSHPGSGTTVSLNIALDRLLS